MENQMIRLKRKYAHVESYVYVRPESVISIWQSTGHIAVELSGKDHELLVDGTVESVAAKLGLKLVE